MTERVTATALLDAAEAEFAENGIDSASLRSIMRAAGANSAAVHYHYGSREALARAVLDRILEPLQRRRLELLDRSLRDSATPSLEVLIDALIRPDFEGLLEARSRDPRSTRIVGAIYSRPPDFVKTMVEGSFAPVAQRFVPHMVAAMPSVPPDELSWRVRWSVFGMVGAVLVSGEAERITETTVEREIRRAVAAATGAVGAPTSEESSQ